MAGEVTDPFEKKEAVVEAVGDDTNTEYGLDWDTRPYPKWLRDWMNKIVDEIQKRDKSVRYSDAKDDAKEIIDREFAENRIPPEFLPQPAPEGTEPESPEMTGGKALIADEKRLKESQQRLRNFRLDLIDQDKLGPV